MAECYYNQGMFVEAINIYNESRDLAHKAGNSRFVSLVSLNMARCYIYLREYDKALENITLAKNQAAATSELYYPILVEEIKLQLYAERKPLEALNRMEELLGSNDWVLDENTKIFCKVAIINYDTSIIDQIVEGDVYQTIHGDYSNPHYQALAVPSANRTHHGSFFVQFVHSALPVSVLPMRGNIPFPTFAYPFFSPHFVIK